MYGNNEQQRHLYKKLTSDPKYTSIVNRFDRMRYLVQRHSKHLANYGNYVLEECAKHERASRKATNTANYYIARATMLAEKHLQEKEPLTEQEYNEMMAAWDRAVRNLPVNWNDWPAMYTLLKLYVTRANVEFDRQKYSAAKSDLRHANSVITYFNNPEEMKTHFVQEDASLLVAMAVLTAKLLDQHNGTGGNCFQQVIEASQLVQQKPIALTREKVDHILEMLRNMNSALNLHRERNNNVAKSGLNYEYSGKIQLENRDDAGRFYVATSNLAPDEDILWEKANSVVIFHQHLFEYCNYCHQAIETYWPCSNCIELAFCSAKCSMLAHAEYHRFECGILGLILGEENYYSMAHAYRVFCSFGMEIAMECENKIANKSDKTESFSMAEFFASEPLRTKEFRKLAKQDKELLYRALASLLSHRGEHDSARENNQTMFAVVLAHCFIYKGVLNKEMLDDQEMYSRLLEHLATLMLRFCTNGFCWAIEVEKPASDNPQKRTKEIARLASCVSFVASFVNHSCDPNVSWFVSEGGIVQFSAARPILPGEPLTICYGPKKYTEFSTRQARLRNDYCFYCRCEVCMKDAANSVDTLKCHSSSGNCTGPLVLNQFKACLVCGHQSSSDEIQQAKSIASKSSDKFMRIIEKMCKPQEPSFVNHLGSCLFGTENQQENHSDKPTIQQDDVDNMNRSYITKRRVDKMEKYFHQYASVIFGASYHLLEKCTLLLKVYHEAGIDERGLSLVGHLNQCLEHIYPSLTDIKLGKLIYMLDYATNFFEYLATQVSFELDNSVNKSLWELTKQLNAKLLDILEYDMAHRGDFFPVLFKQLQQNGGHLQAIEATLDKNEQYFYKLHQECQRRLNNIQVDIQN